MTVTLRYQVQAKWGDEWRVLFSESSRAYCQGYIARCRDEPMPRLAWRIVDSKTGRVIEEVSPRAEVDLGMVAGWPTAEQYEAAAARAMEAAARIREMGARRREGGQTDGE